MNRTQITELQRHIGTPPDGFWGSASISACKRHLIALMPRTNPWPRSDQPSLTRFYGQPGDESKLTNLDVTGLGVKYDGKTVKTIRCHGKVAASIHRVLTDLARTHPEILAEYAGCYNNRVMRGGSLPSLHARGAAIDFDPGRNGNRVAWPVTAQMPIEVMEVFAKEGWLSAGAAWGRDGMHFQATQ